MTINKEAKMLSAVDRHLFGSDSIFKSIFHSAMILIKIQEGSGQVFDWLTVKYSALACLEIFTLKKQNNNTLRTAKSLLCYIPCAISNLAV